MVRKFVEPKPEPRKSPLEMLEIIIQRDVSKIYTKSMAGSPMESADLRKIVEYTKLLTSIASKDENPLADLTEAQLKKLLK